MWELEVLQDGDDDGRVCDEGENPHGAATGGAEQRQHLVDPSKQDGPADTSGIGGASGLSIERWLWPWARGLGCGLANARDGSTEFGVRSEHSVVPVAVEAWAWYEPSEPLEKLQRREPELGAAVRSWLRQSIDKPGLGRGERDDAAGGVQPL